MAVRNALFLFEVVLQKINYFVEEKLIVIKGDFANIFSLELKDPKSLHIQIPDPLPLPPEPPGKKKKKPPKPKKGKKGKLPPPEPPEPEILAGQSVLISTSAEVLAQNMKSCPLQVSLWSKDENLTYIGCSSVCWDEVFLKYLENVYRCENATAPIVKDEYNVFEEATAKLIAKFTMQVKLTYLTDKIFSSFRTLSEDPVVKKLLYTGMNSKTTSFMCFLKTTDEEFKDNIKKIPNKYIKDVQPNPISNKPVAYADYKNAPAAAIPLSGEEMFCCQGNSDKLDSHENREGVFPDIDYIRDYVRKIIISCNDNMRMLTPRPAIKPRFRATDMDKLCYCKETNWPQGDLAERFKKETQGGPCPICIQEVDGKPRPGMPGASQRVLDIANIRGPCGRPDCRIARDIRAYLEKLVEEDNQEIILEDIVGPCGSKECTLVDKIKDFLSHRGKFIHTEPGLGTQCACLEKMQKALVRSGSCTSICSHSCESDENDNCGGKACPYNPGKNTNEQKAEEAPNPKKPTNPKKPEPEQKVYFVYYFNVEYNNSPPSTPGKTSSGKSSPQTTTTPGQSGATSMSSQSKSTPSKSTLTEPGKGIKFKHCAETCPTAFASGNKCSKSVCGIAEKLLTERRPRSISCTNAMCPTKEAEHPEPETPSPADSEVILKFDEIRNPCCVKSCDVAERVKDLIMEGLDKKARAKTRLSNESDPCFCDCVCDFPTSAQTTYCPVCGGYEILGTVVKEQPAYLQPHPCPVYHNLQDTQKSVEGDPHHISKKVVDDKSGESISTKAPRQTIAVSKAAKPAAVPSSKTVKAKSTISTNTTSVPKFKCKTQGDLKKKIKQPSANHIGAPASRGPHHKFCHTSFDFVPKNMGWLWTAEDIPGMKPRPKWKPGAANKILVRRYRTVREGVDIILKKKRALMNRKKKIEMKPTLVVTKKDGEYTVQMEVFKKYSKERLPHQYPYDEKPPLIYTIGKTEETKIKLQKQRERKERRESRRKSRMLQSTFRDKCQEICLKAYNQSIGILPMPNVNNPECPCDIRQIKTPSPVIDSCSCSETGSLSSSDTDGDDWIIEFSPPMASWTPKIGHLITSANNESQYNYLDYKVKCLDKQGNQVPRFFKGPDGKQECSDLGGFYGPDHIWLEINKDGYIGPDNRWVPLTFIGPDGQNYMSEEGHFTDSAGRTYKIGVDGYVDKDGKWQCYGNRRSKGVASAVVAEVPKPAEKSKEPKSAQETSHGKYGAQKQDLKKKPQTTSTPPPDSKLKTKKSGILKASSGKKPVVMNVALNYRRKMQTPIQHHDVAMMSKKEIDKLNRYQEILDGLQMYDEMAKLRPPIKTNRAVETRGTNLTRRNASKNSVYDSNGLISTSNRIL